MSLDPLTRRFDQRWLYTPIKTDGEELFGAPDADPYSAPEESTSDPVGQEFDEALEQIASEEWCVCPLCGVIVASDGSVVS